MEPISVIVSALTLGFAAAVQPYAEQAVKDASRGLKALIQDKYKIHLDSLEKMPDSKLQQEEIKGQLADANAAADAEIIEKAVTIIQAVERSAPEVAQTIGVNLGDVQTSIETFRNAWAWGGLVKFQELETQPIRNDFIVRNELYRADFSTKFIKSFDRIAFGRYGSRKDDILALYFSEDIALKQLVVLEDAVNQIYRGVLLESNINKNHIHDTQFISVRSFKHRSSVEIVLILALPIAIVSGVAVATKFGHIVHRRLLRRQSDRNVRTAIANIRAIEASYASQPPAQSLVTVNGQLPPVELTEEAQEGEAALGEVLDKAGEIAVSKDKELVAASQIL